MLLSLQFNLLSCSGQLKTNKQQKNNLEPSFLNQNKHTHNRGAGNAFITFGEDQDGKKWRQADSIDFPTVWRKIPRRSRRLWINSFPLQVGRTMTRTRRDVHQRLQNTRRHFFPVVKRKSQSSLIQVAPSRSCNIHKSQLGQKHIQSCLMRLYRNPCVNFNHNKALDR